MNRSYSTVLLASICCSIFAATAHSACQPLDLRADKRFRYLLCSEGLYDRKTRALLAEFRDGKVLLPVATLSDRGFKSAMITVPDRYPGLTWITADGSKVLAWANEDGVLLFTHRIGSDTFQTYIVARDLVDQSGLSIGLLAPKRRCRWGEGTLTCQLEYIRTNQARQNYALAENDRIEAFVISHRDDRKPPTARSRSSIASALPNRIGDCVVTMIAKITDRFGAPLTATPKGNGFGPGSAVSLSNGGFQVSYYWESTIARSRVGDRVRVCLVSIPKDCPPGDDRGRIYNSTNLRTGEAWTLPDSKHQCGGA